MQCACVYRYGVHVSIQIKCACVYKNTVRMCVYKYRAHVCVFRYTAHRYTAHSALSMTAKPWQIPRSDISLMVQAVRLYLLGAKLFKVTANGLTASIPPAVYNVVC